MNPRALAIDLDGTLLNADEEVSERNQAALRAACVAGLEIIIASARWFQLAERASVHAPTAKLVIACSGAQVRSIADRTDTWDVRLPGEFSEALYDICDAQRCIATFAYDEEIAIRLENPPASNPRFPEVRYVPALAGHTAMAPRIALIQGGDITAHIRDRLESTWSGAVHFMESISSRGKPILTLTDRRADKGTALLHAAETLGIDASDVIAFGDSGNDLEMFRVAGASVAMGNGTAAAKAAATARTASNVDDGVAVAIEYLLAHGTLEGLEVMSNE